MEDYPLKTIIVTRTNRKLKRKKEVKCVEYVREIFAQYDRQCIRVYQAYNPIIAKEGTVTQAKFWLVNYLNSGVFEEMSGWVDITDQVEKANRKGKKKHGKVF